MKQRVCLVWMTAVILLAALVYGEAFRDGETVCFLGDSITNGGRYQRMIQDYYLTRFPGRTIWFVNAGRSGDTAGGALGRLQDDVIDTKPTSVAVMFGMNDVGRGSYVENPDEKQIAAQQGSLNGYRKNMETLTARIRAEAKEPKLFFVTPSPFDQTGINDRNNNQPGCNDGLGRCAEIVRELAVKNNGTLVEFHKPMTEFNLEQQKKDPKYTIVGSDRVHPGSPGLLMMAWLFLKEQGVSPLVSSVTVDAAAGRVAACDNAEVSTVTKNAGGVTFTVHEKALPFPVDREAKAMLELLPIEKDLNQELLSVTGLTAGTYLLKIDGVEVGRYQAENLAKGINLAFNELTPQYRQAQQVAQRNERRRSAEVDGRGLLNTRRWMKSYYKIDVDDPAAVQAHYDRFEDKKSYNAAMALNYIKKWQSYNEIISQAAAYEKEMFENRAPVPHVYEVLPADSK